MKPKRFAYHLHFVATVLAVALLPATLGSQAPGAATQGKQKQYFLALFYPTWKSPEEAVKWNTVLQQHGGHLNETFQAGKLVVGGPRTDSVYGVAVLETDSEEDARRIIEEDPAVKAGAFRTELHALRVGWVRKAN